MTTQKLQLSVRTYEIGAAARHKLPTGYHAISVMQGTIAVESAQFETGQGFFATPDAELRSNGSKMAKCLSFSLQATPSDLTPILTQQVQIPSGQSVLRLDQVTFPAGAIAYRHVHAGPGIRYLLRGSLDVQSDHGTELMKPGDAWFEDKDAPVRAVASRSGETAFIRATILPKVYLGKPSISYLDAEDKAKPKLQTNTRFFDQIIEIGERKQT